MGRALWLVFAVGLFGLGMLLVVGELGYYRTYGCFFSFGAFDACKGGLAGGVLYFVLGEALLLWPATLLMREAYRRFPSTPSFLYAAAAVVAVAGLLVAFIISPRYSCDEGWRIVDGAQCRELGKTPHVYLYVPAHEDQTLRVAFAGGALAVAFSLSALSWRSKSQATRTKP